MASPAILKIDIIGDATKAIAALDKTGTAGKGAGDKLSGLKTTMAGVFGTAAVVAFGKSSVDAALESQKATANLEAGFKSMGETTGDAAQAAEDYAASLSRKIGVDDDAIISAQAQLVTFGNVSDETARAAGVFDRATTAAADLAAKGFGSLDSNSVMLGKALQDPTTGLTALTRAGVGFTDQQKEQIKKLQESGDLLGAQKIVLGEVEEQVGGTAEATVTSQDKMNVAFGETQEAVGNALLPALEELTPILETVAGFVEDNATWLVPMAAGILALAAAVKVVNIATALWNLTLWASPITWIVIGIAALIGIIILMVKHWDKVKAVLMGVWDWIKKNWPLLLAILTGPIGAAVLLIVRNWDTIKNAVLGVFNAIKGAATDAWQWVNLKFQQAADAVSGVWTGIKDTINKIIGGWNNLRFPSATFDTSAAGFLPGVPDSITIGGWDLPNIPKLDTGGTVARTGLAVVHAGEQFSGVGRTFGSTVINLNVTAAGLGADAPEIQRAVVRALRGHVARNGPLDVPVRTA